MHPKKRVSHKTCRKLMVSLVVGASVASGTALAQRSTLPTSLPAQSAEIAPAPRPEMTVTANGAALVVPLGGSRQFQMRGNKPIRSVYNQQDDVASVDPTSDRSKLLISGKKAGTSRLTLTAEDNTKEVVDVVVQPDVHYLRSLLMQAVPTANLTLIPAAGGTIIIGGTVTQAEDIGIVLNTAKAVMGMPANVINAMRVGGVQQVALDVVIATVDRTKARQFGLDFLAQGRHYSVVSTFSGSSGSSLSSASSGIGAGTASFTPPAIGQTANVVSGLFNLGDGNNILAFLTALTRIALPSSWPSLGLWH